MQSRDNHVRFDPAYHFLLLPLSLVALVWAIVLLVRHHSQTSIVLVLMAIALSITVYKARIYALKVQDRLIRTEERLRIQQLCAPDLAARAVAQLTEPQYIALRFASDAELPQLVAAALSEDLSTKAIKSRVARWRADEFRV